MLIYNLNITYNRAKQEVRIDITDRYDGDLLNAAIDTKDGLHMGIGNPKTMEGKRAYDVYDLLDELRKEVERIEDRDYRGRYNLNIKEEII